MRSEKLEEKFLIPSLATAYKQCLRPMDGEDVVFINTLNIHLNMLVQVAAPVRLEGELPEHPCKSLPSII